MGTGWFGSSPLRVLPFFCFSTTVMEEKMAWEEALEYCKETHTTLTSLTSETENLLTLKEIQQGTVTDRVWIGLCFLAWSRPGQKGIGSTSVPVEITVEL